jgi:hypothetical protein
VTERSDKLPDALFGLSETELYEVIEREMDAAEVSGLDPMNALKHVIAAAIEANNARLGTQLAGFLESRNGQADGA